MKLLFALALILVFFTSVVSQGPKIKGTQICTMKDQDLSIAFLVDRSGSTNLHPNKNGYLEIIKYIRKIKDQLTISYDKSRLSLTTFTEKGRIEAGFSASPEDFEAKLRHLENTKPSGPSDAAAGISEACNTFCDEGEVISPDECYSVCGGIRKMRVSKKISVKAALTAERRTKRKFFLFVLTDGDVAENSKAVVDRMRSKGIKVWFITIGATKLNPVVEGHYDKKVDTTFDAMKDESIAMEICLEMPCIDVPLATCSGGNCQAGISVVIPNPAYTGVHSCEAIKPRLKNYVACNTCSTCTVDEARLCSKQMAKDVVGIAKTSLQPCVPVIQNTCNLKAIPDDVQSRRAQLARKFWQNQ